LETDSLPAATAIDGWNIQFHPIDINLIAAIVVILLLLFSSALISGSEVAYFSLSAAHKKKLLHKKSKANTGVLKNLENPEKLLATILVVNNFVNVGIIILTAYVTNHLVTILNAPIIEFILQVVLITFFLLLFGEILPKIYANHYALGFAKFMAIPLLTLEKIFRPVNSILLYSSSIVNKRMQRHRKNISMDEISQALELTSDQELSDEKEILEGIVKFGNKSVEEIMKARVDVVSLDIKTSFADVLKVIIDSGYSRIPVYIDSFDNISGILYTKDLLPHSHKGNTFRWQTLIRPPFYVPETKKINSLLEEFQKTRVHFAIVIDEYGGTAGIVTLEDILEEIVGDIADEFDDEEDYFSKLSDNVYLFDGKTLLIDFCRTVDCKDDIFDEVKGDADTLAGLILELKGEIPVKNEKITCKGFKFTIEAVDNRRIKQIKVELNKTA
jgi:gliding motility-associated protein GldE